MTGFMNFSEIISAHLDGHLDAAGRLRGQAALESAALMGERDVPSAFHFRRFYPLIPDGLPLLVHRFHSTIAIALHK